MPVEREWKFVVEQGPSLRGRRGERIEQGYLDDDAGVTVRVRVSGRRAWLTLKAPTGNAKRGPRTNEEFEYAIPMKDARALLARTKKRIVKTRHRLGPVELDVFEGALEGLVLAEVEVEVEVGRGARRAPEPPPGWRWKDVSQKRAYGNSRLAARGAPWGAPRARMSSS
jgi:adenylate cyclase